MSFAVIFMRFSQGEPLSIDRQQLEKILLPYGKIISGEYGWEIISKSNLFEYANIMGEGESEFSGIFFNRPDLSGELNQLIFDLLAIEKTYFFDQNMEYLFSRKLNPSDLPQDIAENGACEILNTTSVNDLREKLVQKGYIS